MTQRFTHSQPQVRPALAFEDQRPTKARVLFTRKHQRKTAAYEFVRGFESKVITFDSAHDPLVQTRIVLSCDCLLNSQTHEKYRWFTVDNSNSSDWPKSFSLQVDQVSCLGGLLLDDAKSISCNRNQASLYLQSLLRNKSTSETVRKLSVLHLEWSNRICHNRPVNYSIVRTITNVPICDSEED